MYVHSFLCDCNSHAIFTNATCFFFFFVFDSFSLRVHEPHSMHDRRWNMPSMISNRAHRIKLKIQIEIYCTKLWWKCVHSTYTHPNNHRLKSVIYSNRAALSLSLFSYSSVSLKSAKQMFINISIVFVSFLLATGFLGATAVLGGQAHMYICAHCTLNLTIKQRMQEENG